MKALRERMEIEKQTWEENYMKKEVCVCVCAKRLISVYKRMFAQMFCSQLGDLKRTQTTKLKAE